MSVDFTYAGAASYRTYLTSLHQRQARSRARHERAQPRRIGRNRRALDRRIRRIEREFGISA